jgi:hypothetical protein
MVNTFCENVALCRFMSHLIALFWLFCRLLSLILTFSGLPIQRYYFEYSSLKKGKKSGQAPFLYESGQGLIRSSEKGTGPFFCNRILEGEDIIELHI